VFTAPRTGDYQISLGVNYTTFVAAGTAIMTAEITGAVVRAGLDSVPISGNFDGNPQLNVTVSLTAGQTISMATFQNTGAARSINNGASRNWLSIVEINPTY
jgi:hypothetical protein